MRSVPSFLFFIIILSSVSYHSMLMMGRFDGGHFLQGGFSKGYFLYTSETFDINREGVVSLMKNASLDRETTDRYNFQVGTCAAFFL